jgi:bisphosphoglycerate-dependent phosphoglycerate mutase
METLVALKARTLLWWTSTITPLIPIAIKSDSPDRALHVLVVGHGAFIRALILALMDHEQGLLSVEPGTRVAICFNTAVTVIHLESPSKGTLIRYGDITHIIKPVPNVAKGSDERP